MKMVTVLDLKKHLSALLSEAARGARILVTRHGKPMAILESSELEHLHIGGSFGKGSILPLLKHATKGHYLEALVEDRRSDREGR